MATGRVMLQLGDFQFSVNTATYQTLSQRSEYRWPSQDLITRRPTRQFVGIGDEQISLSGVIYPQDIGDPNALDNLRESAGKGKPVLLVATSVQGRTGTILGLWVIIEITSSQTIFQQDGVPKRVEFGLTISFYGPNSGGGASRITDIKDLDFVVKAQRTERAIDVQDLTFAVNRLN